MPTHLVATYSVINVVDSSTSGGGLADRASPKSQSCRRKIDNGVIDTEMKTSHLEITIGVEKKVRRLQIAMKNIC